MRETEYLWTRRIIQKQGGERMTTLSAAKARVKVEEQELYGPTSLRGGWWTLVWGSAAIIAIFLGLRLYQELFAFSAGLDSASYEFNLYWRGLFWAELLVIGAFTGLWWGWLVKTGKAIVAEKVTAREEVRRIAVFWGLVGITSIILYFMASFFPNQDGSWHQTVVRDTALTPSHTVMFFGAFPLGITFTIGTYLYGRYRLPAVYGAEKGFPWSFAFLIAASVNEMLQVAFNEWAHSLWITEEFFAAPFHWPFVMYGWLAGGMFALWGETIIRLYQVEKQVEDEESGSVPAAG
jgi:methane/ammonia monooxygenase subunit C